MLIFGGFGGSRFFLPHLPPNYLYFKRTRWGIPPKIKPHWVKSYLFQIILIILITPIITIPGTKYYPKNYIVIIYIIIGKI